MAVIVDDRLLRNTINSKQEDWKGISWLGKLVQHL
jgi:hypothetical protein